MKQFSSLLGMSGWRPPWSSTSPRTSWDSVSDLEVEEEEEVEVVEEEVEEVVEEEVK